MPKNLNCWPPLIPILGTSEGAVADRRLGKRKWLKTTLTGEVACFIEYCTSNPEAANHLEEKGLSDSVRNPHIDEGAAV